MVLAISEVRGIVARACARPDVLEACAQRDLGAIILVLKILGVTQGQISELTGISQGRLSEWACQGTLGSARWRSREVPAGGHQICPVMATRRARGG